MNELTWELEDFERWIERQKENGFAGYVGVSNSCLDCPLAKWRKSLGEYVSISADTIVISTVSFDLISDRPKLEFIPQTGPKSLSTNSTGVT